MTNTQLVYQWFDAVWNNKNVSAIYELMAPTCIAHGLLDESGNEIVGPEKFAGFFKTFITSFPDIQITVDDVVNENDKIAARTTVKLSHTGEHFQVTANKSIAPSGNKVTITGILIARIENNQLVEAWNNYDFLSLYAQLGAVSM